MSKTKYYTPEISEFHVGFEYEHNKNCLLGKNIEKEWMPCVYEYEYAEPLISLEELISENNVRVKYLDESDVKCFAKKNGRYWYEIVVEEDDCKYVYNIRFVEDLFREDVGHKIFISLDETSNGETTKDIILFNGCVKNKSEFEMILKSVNIIDR